MTSAAAIHRPKDRRNIRQNRRSTALTRLVKDRMYSITRSPVGSTRYSASLLDDSRAIQFREGIRLGKPLTINTDRLCHFA